MLLTTSVSSAQRPDDSLGVREICRRKLAGYYLTNKDKAGRLKTYYNHLYKRAKETEAAMRLTEKAVEAAEQSLLQASYDEDKIERFELHQNRYARLKSAFDQQMQISEKAKIDYQAVSKKIESIEKRLFAVFRLKEVDTPSGVYPFHLVYQSPCSKYRANCPLPPEQAKALKNIIGEDETPIECNRYANFK